MKYELKKILKIVLSFALAAVFVFFAFRGIDWKAFFSDIVKTRWAWVIVFFAVSTLALVFRMFRWDALLSPLWSDESGEKHRMKTVWDANNIGNLANVVIPGSGELVRCGYLRSPGVSFEKVLGTIVSERICDVIAIMLLMGLALACGSDSVMQFFKEQVLSSASGKLSFVWIMLSVLALLAIGIWAIWKLRDRSAFCGRIAARFKGFAGGLTSFMQMQKKWLFLLYTLGIWTMYVLMSYSIIKAMPELSGLGFADALFLCAIGNFASVIPVPGGIGAYHYLIALALSGIYGVSWELGLINATLNHELHAVLILLLGVISYISLSVGRRKAQ